MTEKELKKVMEPFYTLNKDRNRKISGMGLRITFMPKNMRGIKCNITYGKQDRRGNYG